MLAEQKAETRKKRTRAKREKNQLAGVASGGGLLAAAAAIAGGTQAYASVIIFENPAGPGHFEWFGGTEADPIILDITLDASSQAQSGYGNGRFGQRNNIINNTGSVTTASPSFGQMQVGGLYNFFLLGVNSFALIPSGLYWSHYGITFYPGFGPESELPENQATYLGVRFTGGHYGWIGVVRTGFELDAFAWGYETEPGVPIAAGIPAPGTLALLAFGAVGGALGRGRKRKVID